MINIKPFQSNETFALELDAHDPLSHYRKQFLIPKFQNEEAIYFCGNSLGLQPKGVKEAIDEELSKWEKLGVEAHFEKEKPWYSYHEIFPDMVSKIVGSKPHEVVLMNSLTVNLHLMMTSFYNPTPKRHKILMEQNPFPSDYYAVETQIRYHGLDPEKSLMTAKPKSNSPILLMEDWEEVFKDQGEEIALVLIGGVNYYTGQGFDIERISRLAKQYGCKIGIDLAHAAGNLILQLHDWEVDFAVWCQYKYLNCGPGAVGGAFVHEQYAEHFNGPRLAGWWGALPDKRFQISSSFKPQPGANGWQISNPPIFSMAPCRVSLNLFNEAGMENLREKSLLLTGYLEFLLNEISNSDFSIITPKNPEERGCQLSLHIKEKGKEVISNLKSQGIICDFREPGCIRIAPVPFYNSFHEVWRFSEIFKNLLEK